MFLVFSLLTLVLIIGSFAFFYSYLSDRLEKDAIDNMNQLTERTSERIESFYNELNHFTFEILNTPEFIDLMNQAAASPDSGNFFKTNVEAGRSIRNYLVTIKSPALSGANVRLYNDRGDYASLASVPEDPEAVRSYLQSPSFQKSYARFIDNDSIHFAGPHNDPYSKDRSDPIVSFYRVFRNYMQSLGVIEIDLSLPNFADTLGVSNLAGMDVYVYDNNGLSAYAKSATEELRDVEFSQLLARYNLASLSGDGSLNRAGSILSYRHTPLSQWTIVLAAPKTLVLSSINVVGRLTVVVSFLFVLLSLTTIFVITRRFTRDIRTVSEKIRHASLDNPSIRIADSGNEFVLISRAFEGMLARLKDSMEKDVQTRSREWRARLHALEAQMDPHFLYNVLTVIGAAGEQAGVSKVMELCNKLASMFRYTSQHQSVQVTVLEELTYAKMYLDLMKERFEDHLQSQLEIDETTLTNPVPRLIFQPLIENCFRHAFNQTPPPWKIRVSIVQTAECSWLFEVADWGDGFPAAGIDNLYRKLEAAALSMEGDVCPDQDHAGVQGGIGLFNTFMRMRLTYSERALCEIVPNHPRGTIIRIGVKRDRVMEMPSE